LFLESCRITQQTRALGKCFGASAEVQALQINCFDTLHGMNLIQSTLPTCPFSGDLAQYLADALHDEGDPLITLNQLATQHQCLVRFIAADSAQAALTYEAMIVEGRQVPTRANLHDHLNALMWLAYPQAKWALSNAHLRAQHTLAPGQLRSPRRDTLTGFDESGVVVLSSDDSLLEFIRSFRWRELFVQQRTRLNECARVFVFGHGLLESLHAPFVGLTAKAILLKADGTLIDAPFATQLAHVDQKIAQLVQDDAALQTPRDLAPLPLLGWPGWYKSNGDESFYDNTNYFRSGRMRGDKNGNAHADFS
jgi:hypothetical protein